MIDWRQGEHIALIGPTGTGKTTVARYLLRMRQYVTVLGTKPRDDSLDKFIDEGYVKTRKWPTSASRNIYDVSMRHLTPASKREQAKAVSYYFDDIYQRGGWTVYLDEVRIVTQHLGFSDNVVLMLTQGRAMGISMVVGTQRPAWVPLEVYSQATHLFLFRGADMKDIRRLGEITGEKSDEIAKYLPHLKDHEIIYANTRNGKVFRAMPPNPNEVTVATV